ncbi:MAG: flagellar export protein FliJ [Desulfobulbaceae bacterium]|nr:flagellar export protein FliJ [Desulfobulbaceae bacterium]
MAYRFRLETLLTYRRNLEEQAQLALAHEIGVLVEHQNRLTDLRDTRLRIAEDFEERKRQTMEAPLFAFYMESIRRKEREIDALLEVIESQQAVVEKARARLGERVKDRKVIEKAREKDHRKYLQEMIRLEQKEGDEQAILRAGREDNLF